MAKGEGSTGGSSIYSILAILKAAPTGYALTLFSEKEIRDLPVQLEKGKHG
jgi:hypothetical protein